MILNSAAYHFVAIDDPQTLVDTLRERAESAGLRGTVLVAGEGVNLFLAGEPDAVRGFYAALRGDARFAGLYVKYSESRHQPFGRLKVRAKPEIISFRHPEATPLAAGERAPSVAPATLARWLDAGHDDAGKPVVMLDTRNAQEVAYGSFAGALTLPIAKFTDLPAALAPHRQALRDATVVSFCTGGIRCEKAALWMRQDGMDNVLQLDGGGWRHPRVFRAGRRRALRGRVLRVRRTRRAGPGPATARGRSAGFGLNALAGGGAKSAFHRWALISSGPASILWAWTRPRFRIRSSISPPSAKAATSAPPSPMHSIWRGMPNNGATAATGWPNTTTCPALPVPPRRC